LTEIIWTRTVRDLLFEQLTTQFGPHHQWEEIDSPGHERNDAYKQFLEAFAQAVGAKSGEAVKMMVHHATHHRSLITTMASHVVIRSLAAALDADFLAPRDLAGLMLLEMPAARAQTGAHGMSLYSWKRGLYRPPYTAVLRDEAGNIIARKEGFRRALDARRHFQQHPECWHRYAQYRSFQQRPASLSIPF
jgi:hypothetical protein